MHFIHPKVYSCDLSVCKHLFTLLLGQLQRNVKKRLSQQSGHKLKEAVAHTWASYKNKCRRLQQCPYIAKLDAHCKGQEIMTIILRKSTFTKVNTGR